jgi:hypothetical protein
MPTSATLLSRRAAEIATALATSAVGGVVVGGALEFGVGWGDAGPEPGTFPFYVGLVVAAASLFNLGKAVARRSAGAFVDREHIERIAAFALPMTAFVAAAAVLGLYVATTLYLILVMRFQGRYGWLSSAAVGVGAAAFFYLVLELWFKVPLLKGPLEPWLGLA